MPTLFNPSGRRLATRLRPHGQTQAIWRYLRRRKDGYGVFIWGKHPQLLLKMSTSRAASLKSAIIDFQASTD